MKALRDSGCLVAAEKEGVDRTIACAAKGVYLDLGLACKGESGRDGLVNEHEVSIY